MVSRFTERLGGFVSHSVFRYGLASILPRGTAILTAIALAPLGIEKLGAVNYGYWVLATQVSRLVVSPDLGLGQGVINEVSEAQRRDGHLLSQRRRLLGLVKLLRLIALTWFALGCAAAFLYAYGDGPDSNGGRSLFVALIVSLACFTAGIPATVWRRAQLAQERGHVSVLWEGAGKVTTLGACIGVLLFFPSLTLLVVAYALPPTIAIWLNAFTFTKKEFVASSPVAVPSITEAFALNRHVFVIGWYFVLLQVCYIFRVAVDPFLINILQSTLDVTYVNVMRRPYDALPLVISLFSTSLWPVLARMHANQKWVKLRRATLGTAAAGYILVGALGLVVVAFARRIYAFLGRGEVNPNQADLIWVTLEVAAVAAVMVVTTYLNSISVVRTQAVLMVGSTVVVFGAKVVALTRWDIHAYVAAGSATYMLATAVPITALALRYLLSEGRKGRPGP